jgi:hypothetical protein
MLQVEIHVLKTWGLHERLQIFLDVLECIKIIILVEQNKIISRLSNILGSEVAYSEPAAFEQLPSAGSQLWIGHKHRLNALPGLPRDYAPDFMGEIDGAVFLVVILIADAATEQFMGYLVSLLIKKRMAMTITKQQVDLPIVQSCSQGPDIYLVGVPVLLINVLYLRSHE